jgi:hypothetical protein
MSDASAASSTSSIPDEEEPRLKYQRLEADTGDLLLETEAACLCVSDKMLAMGTRDGTVHLLDYDGNEVLHYMFYVHCAAGFLHAAFSMLFLWTQEPVCSMSTGETFSGT